ncbi:MAG: phosphate ABC transporter substrate-binding/OmpA family protein [Aliishimia sp.]
MNRTIKTTTSKIAIAAALMMSISAPAQANTNEVILKSSDGSINLAGDLLEFNDEFYVLRTSLGDLRVSAERVRCEGGACPVFETAKADFTIAGSDAVGLGLMPLLLEGYASFLDAEATVVSTNDPSEIFASFVGDGGFGDDLSSYLVSSTKSSNAFSSLLNEEAVIGMTSRRIKPDEARALKAAGGGNMVSPDQEHIIAVDGLVLITHPSNPISSLSVEQVADIYNGQIKNWSQVGGADLPITLVGRQDGSGTRSVFEDRIYGDSGTGDAGVTIAKDGNEVASIVNADTGAIGYTGFAFTRGAKPLSLVNECGITMTPDAFSAATEEYALQRRLYLYNRADAGAEGVDEFLTFATSEQADSVIRKAGFVDLGVREREQGADSDRAISMRSANLDDYEAQHAEQMMDQMKNYDRLSTTFRFRVASSRLDERARFDMKRLASYLADKPSGTEIVMVGFTDDVGSFEANQELSGDRAQVVVRQMKEIAPELVDRVKFSTKGYGEIAPVACNVSDSGRAINRRVEVWVKAPNGANS